MPAIIGHLLGQMQGAYIFLNVIARDVRLTISYCVSREQAPPFFACMHGG